MQRVVRKSYTVHYKGRAYPGGATIDFEKADEATPYAHQLEAEGFTPKESAEGKDAPGSAQGDAFQHASGDTESTDAKRQLSEGTRQPDKAQYDAEMTNLSQRLAENAHGVKPTGEFPQALKQTEALPSTEMPKEEKGAPLLANSPDDAPTGDAPEGHERKKKPTKK